MFRDAYWFGRGMVVVALLIGGVVFWAGVAGSASPAKPKCLGATATIVGDAGDNVLVGTKNRDVIVGLGGNDTITGLDGKDIVCGGDGNDVIDGGAANDELEGGAGTDAVSFGSSAGPVTVDLAAGTASGDGIDSIGAFEDIAGSAFDDTLVGDGGDNRLQGRGGVDAIDGRSGADLVDYADAAGGIVADLATQTVATPEGTESLVSIESVRGTDLADTLRGSSGENAINGGGGADVLNGRAGSDMLDGGGGKDAVDLADAPSGATVDLASGTSVGDGADTLASIESALGSPGTDALSGNDGANVLRGRGGDDTLVGRAGNDTLDGGDGVDTVDYSGSAGPVTVSLGVSAAGDGDDELSDVENVIGTPADDTFAGVVSAPNRIDGGAGADTVDYSSDGPMIVDLALGDAYHQGQLNPPHDALVSIENAIGSSNAASILRGDDGPNVLRGGPSDHDRIDGRGGNDVLDGGDSGRDAVEFSDSPTGVVVDLEGAVADGDGHDLLVGFEDIFGSTHADVLRGDDGPNTIGAGSGSQEDTLVGRGGDDDLNGNSFTVIVSYAGSPGPVDVDLATSRVTGDGTDRLNSISNVIGSAHADNLADAPGKAGSLKGGPGDDVFVSRGNATLDGGLGDDTASFADRSGSVFASLTGTAPVALVAIEGLVGSDFADTLVGDEHANMISGGPGDDTLDGSAGSDHLDGGEGGDTCLRGEVVVSCEVAVASILTVELSSDLDYVDPGLSYLQTGWQLLDATCDRLVRVASSGTISPQVAASLPSVSDDGLTYTFELRPGLRFSPPSGAPIDAAAFKAAFERLFTPLFPSPATPFFRDILGADAVLAGTATSIVGIEANGLTLTFRLTAPRGDFLSRLAMTFACPVPPGTPTDPSGLAAPIPSSGPYYIAARRVNESILLVRNPNYGGARSSVFDGIEYLIGKPTEAITSDVESGDSDYTPAVDRASIERLRAAYGAAGASQRFFESPIDGLSYVALNTSRPTFADERLRRAVAFALDRTALSAAAAPLLNVPADQILPPSSPGYVDGGIFPLTSALDSARALAESAGVTPASPIDVVLYASTSNVAGVRAGLIRDELAPLGIIVEIRTFSRGEQLTREATPGEPWDLGLEGWIMDYLDPSNVLDALLNGRNVSPPGRLGTNLSWFDDPLFNSRLDDAAASGAGPARTLLYSGLDVDLTASAPIVPFGLFTTQQLISDSIGCLSFDDESGLLHLAALCRR